MRLRARTPSLLAAGAAAGFGLSVILAGAPASGATRAPTCTLPVPPTLPTITTTPTTTATTPSVTSTAPTAPTPGTTTSGTTTAGTPTSTPTTPTSTTGGTPVPGTTTPTTTGPIACAPAAPPVPAPATIPPGPNGAPFLGRGMWIWVLSSSDGGNLQQLIADAQRYGIQTLIIKSSDGLNQWSQFNPTMVATLHAAGLHVCAWQYVYGVRPVLEARVGAAAAHLGADCMVIDAEMQYEGRYVQAQRYVRTLRRLVGPNFPLALAGFPYVSYHPAFPYSIFLGPQAAQFNTPQMYWQDIGTTVAAVYRNTYAFNELYQRPIEPLGQLFGAPPTASIYQFRSISRPYGAGGLSWWDWQSAGPVQFQATAQPIGAIPGFVAETTVASLYQGEVGDPVVWAQEHLAAAGQRVAIDGVYGPQTAAAVATFQLAHGLTQTGTIDPYTWTALLKYPPVPVRWVLHRRGLHAVIARGGVRVEPVPRSARWRGRDELRQR